MPRAQRITRPNQCYHVMLRGVGGQNIFTDNAERIRFCLLLQAASEKHDFKVHAFCLMGNHVHLVLEPISIPLSIGIHSFSFRYAQYFNKKHHRRGYLFQGRYKAILVEDGLYLKRVIRYIHLNPIEAGLSLSPEDYKWSSHKAYLGKADYVWLNTERVLSRFGNSNSERLLKFAEFVHSYKDVQEDRDAIRQGIKEGVFGSKTFALSLTAPENGFTENVLDISFEEALEFVCGRFQVTPDQLASSERCKHSVDARSTLSLIARRAKSWSLEDVATALGKNNGTLSRLATRALKSPVLLRFVEELSSK